MDIAAMPIQASSIITPSETVILIADDLQDNLNIVKAVLGYKGYQVDTAKNGKLVLEQIERRMPDLLLLDIQMPEMNGIEACRQLKANPRFKDIPIIFLTAKADSYDVIDGFKLVRWTISPSLSTPWSFWRECKPTSNSKSHATFWQKKIGI